LEDNLTSARRRAGQITSGAARVVGVRAQVKVLSVAVLGQHHSVVEAGHSGVLNARSNVQSLQEVKRLFASQTSVSRRVVGADAELEFERANSALQ
jgi:hypothetical protein